MMARTGWCWIDTSVLTSYSFGIDSFQRYHEYNYVQTVGGCITSKCFQYVNVCAKKTFNGFHDETCGPVDVFSLMLGLNVQMRHYSNPLCTVDKASTCHNRKLTVVLIIAALSFQLTYNLLVHCGGNSNNKETYNSYFISSGFIFIIPGTFCLKGPFIWYVTTSVFPMHGGKCNDLDALLRKGLSLPTDKHQHCEKQEANKKLVPLQKQKQE